MNLEFISAAFSNVFNIIHLAAIFLGIMIGIVIGALPGLSATMGVALLLPLTFGMEPELGLPMLIALYCGAMYGGSISAILLHTPGTSAAAATCMDGYPMSNRGEGGRAIGFSLIASFIGGTFSAFLLITVAPLLANVSLLFGPSEYFVLSVLGLTLIATLSSEEWIKGLISGSIGLFIATIGIDPMTTISRFTFGNMNLLGGISLIVLLIGVFSISQALKLLEKDEKKDADNFKNIKISGRILPKFSELIKLKNTIIRSSIIGSIIGAIPGTGGGIACWVGYNEAKRVSKNPESFGTGIPEGVVASEAANNAVTGSALIPTLVLGIPGSSVTAVLLGGLIYHGIRPGPRFISEFGDLTYTIMISLFVANFFMLFAGALFAKASIQVKRVRGEVLSPFIIVLSVIGSYAINNSTFDVILMFIFGIIGYIMIRFKFPVAPMVIALILAPMAELGLRQTLLISRGNWLVFLTKPLSAILLILVVLSLGSAIYKDIKKERLK